MLEASTPMRPNVSLLQSFAVSLPASAKLLASRRPLECSGTRAVPLVNAESLLMWSQHAPGQPWHLAV